MKFTMVIQLGKIVKLHCDIIYQALPLKIELQLHAQGDIKRSNANTMTSGHSAGTHLTHLNKKSLYSISKLIIHPD